MRKRDQRSGVDGTHSNLRPARYAHEKFSLPQTTCSPLGGRLPVGLYNVRAILVEFARGHKTDKSPTLRVEPRTARRADLVSRLAPSNVRW